MTRFQNIQSSQGQTSGSPADDGPLVEFIRMRRAHVWLQVAIAVFLVVLAADVVLAVGTLARI